MAGRQCAGHHKGTCASVVSPLEPVRNAVDRVRQVGNLACQSVFARKRGH